MIRPEVIAAERHLIGQVLLKPDTIDTVAVYPEQFADTTSREVWRAMVGLRCDSKPIDAVLVAEAIPERMTELRREVPTFLSRCALDVGTADNAEFYAEIIRVAHLHREAMLSLSATVERGKTGELYGESLIGEALAVLAKIDRHVRDTSLPIGEIVRERFAELENMARQALETGKRALNGAMTGVDALDAKLGGLRWGLATVVAGRPGMGKSSLALGIAESNTAAGVGVHEFSLEDTRDTRADRAIARLSQVSAQDMQRMNLNREDMERIHVAANKLHKRRNWIVDDRSGITAEEIVRSVRRRRRENGTRVVVVDYLQLLARPAKASSVHEWHSHNINVLADAAKQDGLCYVILSQLSREVERRNDKRPMLSDLRESGAIEERAKQVIGLYRGSYYGAPTRGIDYGDDRPRPNAYEWEKRIDLIVMKNQNGSTGTVEATWHGPTTTIR